MNHNEVWNLIERSREAIRLSRSLVPEARAVQARVAADRQERAQYRQQFPIVIRGASAELADARAIRGKVVVGILPHATPAKAVHGPGEGHVFCCACQQVIDKQQIEVHAYFGGGPTLRFHTYCFRAWQRARQAA